MSSARSNSDLASAQFSAEDDGSPWYDHSTLGSPCLFSEAGSAHSDTEFGEFELPRDVDDLTVATELANDLFRSRRQEALRDSGPERVGRSNVLEYTSNVPIQPSLTPTKEARQAHLEIWQQALMADWLDEVHSGNELVGPGWQRALGALNDFGIKEADLIDLQQILDGVEELLEGLHIPPRQKAFILNAWPTRKFFIEELRQRAVATNRILSRMSWIPPISNREYEQFLAMGYMSDAGVPEESEPIRPESPTDDQLPIHGRPHQPDPTQGYCPVCPGSLSFQTWNTNSSWPWATHRTKASRRRLVPLVRLHWRMLSSPFRTGLTRPLQRKAFRPNRRSLRRPRRRARSSRRQWFLQLCWIFPSSSAFNAVSEPIYTIRENLEIPLNFWVSWAGPRIRRRGCWRRTMPTLLA